MISFQSNLPVMAVADAVQGDGLETFPMFEFLCTQWWLMSQGCIIRWCLRFHKLRYSDAGPSKKSWNCSSTGRQLSHIYCTVAYITLKAKQLTSVLLYTDSPRKAVKQKINQFHILVWVIRSFCLVFKGPDKHLERSI